MNRQKLSPDRCFDPDPATCSVARDLFQSVAHLPLVSPHGHVDPSLFLDPNASLWTPPELFLFPDHYLTRLLHASGIPLDELGIQRRDGTVKVKDHRRIWQLFAERFPLFRGTPSGLWFSWELADVFGIEEELSATNAGRLYDLLEEKIQTPTFSPRALFERFHIEVLATTDAATARLDVHQALQKGGWERRLIPTFRPDALFAIDAPDWQQHLQTLSHVSGISIETYAAFIRALEKQRAHFKELGATATDHAVLTPFTERLSEIEAREIFDRALRKKLKRTDAGRFIAHMLMEMARMSCEDGLVMQLHAGSLRNHDEALFARFGPDRGADIPVRTEWTQNLRPLLNSYGNHPRFHLILFTLDETTYSRELAPLAGYYSAVYLGPPWWFLDSIEGIERYLDAVVPIAGLQKTAGFTDDTRAFPSIPVRHELWRRVTCNWLARLVVRGLLDEEGAAEAAKDLAYHLTKRAYNLL